MENIGYIAKSERQNPNTGKIERELIFTIGCDTFKLPVTQENDYLGKDSIKKLIEQNSRSRSHKFVNKNKKLKRSKLFVSQPAYDKICENKGVKFEDHRNRVENNNLFPEDLAIIATIFNRITTIIK